MWSPGDLRIWKRVFFEFSKFCAAGVNFSKRITPHAKFWGAQPWRTEMLRFRRVRGLGAPSRGFCAPSRGFCAPGHAQGRAELAPWARLGAPRRAFFIWKHITTQTLFSEVGPSFKTPSSGGMLRSVARLENFGARPKIFRPRRKILKRVVGRPWGVRNSSGRVKFSDFVVRKIFENCWARAKKSWKKFWGQKNFFFAEKT